MFLQPAPTREPALRPVHSSIVSPYCITSLVLAAHSFTFPRISPSRYRFQTIMAPSSRSSSPAPSLTSSVIILLHVTFSNRDLAPALAHLSLPPTSRALC